MFEYWNDKIFPFSPEFKLTIKSVILHCLISNNWNSHFSNNNWNCFSREILIFLFLGKIASEIYCIFQKLIKCKQYLGFPLLMVENVVGKFTRFSIHYAFLLVSQMKNRKKCINFHENFSNISNEVSLHFIVKSLGIEFLNCFCSVLGSRWVFRKMVSPIWNFGFGRKKLRKCDFF